MGVTTRREGTVPWEVTGLKGKDPQGYLCRPFFISCQVPGWNRKLYRVLFLFCGRPPDFYCWRCVWCGNIRVSGSPLQDGKERWGDFPVDTVTEIDHRHGRGNFQYFARAPLERPGVTYNVTSLDYHLLLPHVLGVVVCTAAGERLSECNPRRAGIIRNGTLILCSILSVVYSNNN